MSSPSIPRPKSAPDINSPPSPSNSYLPSSTKSMRSSRSAGSPITASSPYYKGLTDFSLVINREKYSGSSPGRESNATSFISSGSKSSFVLKVQEWGSSCFTSSRKLDKTSSSSSSFGSFIPSTANMILSLYQIRRSHWGREIQKNHLCLLHCIQYHCHIRHHNKFLHKNDHCQLQYHYHVYSYLHNHQFCLHLQH